MGALQGKTVFVSGGSRGVGLAIAKACAACGANVAIGAKTLEPNAKLPGTLVSAAAEIASAGAPYGVEALPLFLDIRDGQAVKAAAERVAGAFGGIDIVVNNASAIFLADTSRTPLKRLDLMFSVNARGTYAFTQACLPYLLKSAHARILTISPPLDFSAQWFRNHTAYSLTKYGMSVLCAGWAAEFEGRIGVNALWPRTTIDTAAIRNLLGGEKVAQASRHPRIMGDAAVCLMRKPLDFSGWFCLDDLILANEGVDNFDDYAITPGADLHPDVFVPASAPSPQNAKGFVGWRAPTL